MPKYVNADDVLKLQIDDNTGDRFALGWNRAIAKVATDLPTADVAPVVHAHWKYIGMMPDASYIYECSKCGRRIFIDWSFLLKDYPSCHCGARMDEEAAP